MEKYQLFDRALLGEIAWLKVLNLTRIAIDSAIFKINLKLIFDFKMTKETGRNKKNN